MLFEIFTGFVAVSSVMFTTATSIMNVNNIKEPRARIMRVTGYSATGHKSAIGQKVIPGKTAAVSRNCAYMLNEDVYVEGHGVWHVNDLTAAWVGNKFKICTIDLAMPNETTARQVGNKHKNVVRLTSADKRTTKRSR